MRLFLTAIFALSLNLSPCRCFSTSSSVSLFGARCSTSQQRLSARRGSKSNDMETVVNGDVTFSLEDLGYKDAELLTFQMTKHKPLGCTVEESLAQQDKGETSQHPPVFVVKVAEDGYAQEAGLQVGDVILGVTGIFDKVTNVVGMGLEHVKSLVSGRPTEQTLELVVVRGTDVMANHETALVDLCTMPTTYDKQVDDCVATIHGMSYADFDEDEDAVNGDDATNGQEDDMMEGMFNMWAEEIRESTPQPEPDAPPKQSKKPAPWSSRSSPSGTYVRDPTTGELRNIDA